MFEQDLTLSLADAQNLVRPCVYVFWLGTICQYIGKSEHGIVRPLSPSHQATSLPDFQYDKLDILWQPDVETAEDLERDLIWRYSPQYNQTCVAWLSRRSSGADMPRKGYNSDTKEFLVITDKKVVFRSKDKKARGIALSQEMTRVRKEQADEFKRQARQQPNI